MVILTCGFWLLLISFYPARCINCGLTRGTAITANFSDWYRGLRRPAQLLLFMVPVGLVVFLAISNLSRNTHEPNRALVLPSSSSADQNTSTVRSVDLTYDHELHLVPNLFGRGAVSDGRTYSVALISLSRDKIPPSTTLFVQGTILGNVDANVIILADEQEPKVKLMCAMSYAESEDARYYHKVGEAVQIGGNFGMTNLGLPILRDCHVASATDKVVRLLNLPAPVEQAGEPENTSNVPPAQASQQEPATSQSQEPTGVWLPLSRTAESITGQVILSSAGITIAGVTYSLKVERSLGPVEIQNLALSTAVLESSTRVCGTYSYARAGQT
jgi:hypothetical protein